MRYKNITVSVERYIETGVLKINILFFHLGVKYIPYLCHIFETYIFAFHLSLKAKYKHMMKPQSTIAMLVKFNAAENQIFLE